MTRPTVVVARAPEPDVGQRVFDDELARVLTRDHGLDVLIVPHLYYLNSAHPGTQRLAALPASAVVGARLSPRASRWVLAALGLDAAKPFAAYVDLRAHESPEACALAMVQHVAATDGRDTPGEITAADGAVLARWYPVVDYDRCRGCRKCYDFCLFEVYDTDPDRGVVAARADNCKDGCPACARVCPHEAIMFPHCPDPVIAGDQEASPDASTLSESARSNAPAHDPIDKLIDELEDMDDG